MHFRAAEMLFQFYLSSIKRAVARFMCRKNTLFQFYLSSIKSKPDSIIELDKQSFNSTLVQLKV